MSCLCLLRALPTLLICLSTTQTPLACHFPCEWPSPSSNAPIHLPHSAWEGPRQREASVLLWMCHLLKIGKIGGQTTPMAPCAVDSNVSGIWRLTGVARTSPSADCTTAESTHTAPLMKQNTQHQGSMHPPSRFLMLGRLDTRLWGETGPLCPPGKTSWLCANVRSSAGRLHAHIAFVYLAFYRDPLCHSF